MKHYYYKKATGDALAKILVAWEQVPIPLHWRGRPDTGRIFAQCGLDWIVANRDSYDPKIVHKAEHATAGLSDGLVMLKPREVGMSLETNALISEFTKWATNHTAVLPFVKRDITLDDGLVRYLQTVAARISPFIVVAYKAGSYLVATRKPGITTATN